MKINRYKSIVLVMLFAFFTLGVIASFVSAQTPTVNARASVTSSNRDIRQDATYTFTIVNTGTANLGSANISAFDFQNIRNLAVPSSGWNITDQVVSNVGSFILLQAPDQGLAPGQNVTFTFNAINPQTAGVIKWAIGLSQNNTTDGLNAPEKIVVIDNPNSTPVLKVGSILPALAILGIAAGIAFLNSGLNRVLINYFIGWEQYTVMQKEMNEYRQESMAAARAGDKKQMEKLKKKQSQITAMNAKMLKPQMVQFGISFVYLIVWFLVLTPTFGSQSMAYLPGFGPIPVFYLYPLLSLFLGLLSSRIIGIMPIEPR